MASPLNVILIVCDTLRADYLSCLGSPWVQTPNLDRLARESVLFDRAFACSFPTLPCRAELLTGKFVFPNLTWGPLPEEAVTLAQRLGAAGYETALISDNLPVSRKNSGYDRGYQSHLRVRGQWYDPYGSKEIPVDLPAREEKLDQVERVRQYLRNVADRKCEEDYFAPRVMTQAAEWLGKRESDKPFFLHIECFDPHEPWDPPAHYVDPQKVGPERIIYPKLGRAGRYCAEELASIRELYAGEVRMVDHWFGTLLDAIERNGLRENTALLFMSDHGVFLGEHNMIGKASKKREDVEGWPPYREVSHIPLIARLPGVAPRQVSAYVHPGDLMPTVLDLAGIPVPKGVSASSILPLANGDLSHRREVAVTAWSYRGWRSWHPTCIRNEEWSMIWWRTGIPPRLHHLPTDPTESVDVFPKHRDAARWLHSRYVQFLKQQTCPPKNYWSRRFFLSWAPPRVSQNETPVL